MIDESIAANAIDVTTAVLSVAREKIFEHRLVSDLAELMMRRGVELDVMHGEFDAQGHDVVFEAAGVIRHVQLKVMVAGGKRRDVNVNVRLRSRPSGCVVWMVYDPTTLKVVEYRWFGDGPGDPLPDIGSRIARHTKGNASGEKAFRNGHRLLGKPKFEILDGLEALADRLFGRARTPATSLVLAQLRERFGLEWRERVRASMGSPGWSGSVKLAHLVNGYRVLEQVSGLRPDDWIMFGTNRLVDEGRPDLGDLWTTLFIECRRSRFVDPPEPTGDELHRLDELAAALHSAIEAELSI